jgi:AraC-like DNA-binding protein
VAGKANIWLGKTAYELSAGNIYFISGYHVSSQQCQENMDVYWIHFIPEFFRLRYFLAKTRHFHCWKTHDYPWIEPIYRQLPAIFNKEADAINKPQINPPFGSICQITGLLSFLLGDLLNQYPVENEENNNIGKILNAIDYMDKHYTVNPPLGEIAERAHTSPNYFHRQFKGVAGETPFGYMLRRRMDTAKQMLVFTSDTVKEIAFKTGYQDEFHFSNTFRKQVGVSPSSYRKNPKNANSP